VKAGPWLAVSGTTSFDDRGLIAGKNQMYVQARQAIANIEAALERAGLTLANVIRTRVFLTDMGRFAEAARAHRERFGANPPASTAVEVRHLVHPDMLVEIEADAWAESPAVSGTAIVAATPVAKSVRRGKTPPAGGCRAGAAMPRNPRKRR
jgi:enamine deaminase RidA (YjgF/YER057c/UK114 family)